MSSTPSGTSDTPPASAGGGTPVESPAPDPDALPRPEEEVADAVRGRATTRRPPRGTSRPPAAATPGRPHRATVRPTRTRAALLVGLLVGLLAGCAAGGAAGGATDPAPLARPSAAASTAGPADDVLTVVALGDSYTQGFSSCGRPGDCPTWSWATGSAPQVDSLVRRLGRSRGVRTRRAQPQRQRRPGRRPGRAGAAGGGDPRRPGRRPARRQRRLHQHARPHDDAGGLRPPARRRPVGARRGAAGGPAAAAVGARPRPHGRARPRGARGGGGLGAAQHLPAGVRPRRRPRRHRRPARGVRRRALDAVRPAPALHVGRRGPRGAALRGGLPQPRLVPPVGRPARRRSPPSRSGPWRACRSAGRPPYRGRGWGRRESNPHWDAPKTPASAVGLRPRGVLVLRLPVRAGAWRRGRWP